LYTVVRIGEFQLNLSVFAARPLLDSSLKNNAPKCGQSPSIKPIECSITCVVASGSNDFFSILFRPLSFFLLLVLRDGLAMDIRFLVSVPTIGVNRILGQCERRDRRRFSGPFEVGDV